MTPCPSCQTPNPPAHAFCQQCGTPLRPAGPANATVRWDGVAAKGEVTERVLPVAALFVAKPRLLIGRADDCDLRLEHPSISRRHAELELKPDGLWLTDLGSVNGLLRRGRREPGPFRLTPGERVGVGPFLLSAADGELHVLDGSRRLRLVARDLEKAVPAPGGARKLLERVSLAVEPGEFVTLLGPSGSGKSTLMDCLNGRRRATGGSVLANGVDFYRHFDSFRQSLGYVPQRDIVHTQLTVERALTYTARLRLPTDTGPAELRERVEDVLKLMELLPHRGTLVGQLSGGQIKRVSLGAELLGGPCLLYIDEATSGLDAGTEARMMRLFRQLADQGKSVLCITHALDNVDRCHLAVVLMRGRLVYFGPPGQAPAYFGVARLGEVYDRLAEREPEDWERQFQESDEYRQFVRGRLEEQTSPARSEEPPPANFTPPPLIPDPRGLWHQFRVLTQRYLDLVLGDRRSLLLLALQAPVVAAILLLGFVEKPYEQKILAPRMLTPGERDFARWLAPRLPAGRTADVVAGMAEMDGPVWPDRLIVDPRYTYMLLFIVVIAVLWFGCNNAAKEIVKEEPVYSRERAVNLGILPYLASKFLVLGAITAVQSALVMAVIYGTLDGLHLLLGHDAPSPLYCLDYPAQFGVLALLSLNGVALGLFLSALVSSPDRANALLPYVLIPQIILGGGILTVKDGPLYWIALVASPVYWAFRAVRTGETTLPPDLPLRMDYDDALWIPCAALVVQTAVLLLGAAAALKIKDRQRG
jgi:ABC transport system ATP-binding/permease protein